ncbi:MAG: hypothetical protein M0T84_12170 [Betaproteobacteria bacterium]|nr:hypothetical protein [Betaproteobacteria bacterium]
MKKPAAHAKQRTTPPRLPDTKISATILDFGEPLLSQLDEEAPLEVMRAAIQFVIGVWNGHVLAMPCWRQPEFLEQMKTLLFSGAGGDEAIATFEQLTSRRLEKFSDDARAVGVWDLVPNQEGGHNLRCDARIPPGFTRKR